MTHWSTLLYSPEPGCRLRFSILCEVRWLTCDGKRVPIITPSQWLRLDAGPLGPPGHDLEGQGADVYWCLELRRRMRCPMFRAVVLSEVMREVEAMG